MIDLDVLSRMNADDVTVSTSWKEYKKKANKVLEKCKKRDEGKIKVPHPKLPNTWVFMDPEKARKMGLI